MLPGKVPNTLISIATAVSKTNITTGCRSGHGPARSAFSLSHLIAYEELLVRYIPDLKRKILNVRFVGGTGHPSKSLRYLP